MASATDSIERRDALVERLFMNAIGAFDLFSVYVGERLGLYRIMADVGPLTPTELAHAAGVHERYAREWLEQQAASDLLEVEVDSDGDQRRFRLPEGHDEALLDVSSLNYIAPMARVVLASIRPIDAVLAAFKTGEGVPYADYGEDLHEGQAAFTRPLFENLLGKEWLPAVPELHERLLADPPAQVADIACGQGRSSIEIARAYPKVSVDGIDSDHASIERARENLVGSEVEGRVTFHERDAADAELAGRYDLVTIFEALHDMSYPVDVLRAARGLLGDGGVMFIGVRRFFMQGKSGSRSGVLQWVVVLVVGVLVVTVVLGLNLIPRLNDGQKVLDAAKPAFVTERIVGARAGIDIISKNVDTADPIMTSQGTAATEVPKLIAFVSQKTGLSQAEVVAALRKNFPHTTALLQTIPLSAVTAELPGLLVFLEQTLHVSEAQLLAALKENFPAITQAITNLPTLTNGWDNIKDIGGSTRFDGTPMQTVPQLRTYFSSDLIPVLETQRGNYESLDGTSSVNWISPLLLIVGLVVIGFAGLMIALNLRGAVSRGLAVTGAWVVVAVGVGVVALVLVLALVPRVSNGQKLLDALRPANDAARVHGDRAGITMVSAIVDTEDPIMTPQGGAAAEVPKLIAFVSKQTGLSQAAVVAALQKNFPHTTALLQAIPLSAVTAELPGLLTFLEQALHVSQAQLLAALKANFPAITQAITNLPTLTNGWDNIANMNGSTSFGGTPMKTVPQLRTYFSSDLIPVLEPQQSNFASLDGTSAVNWIAPLLLIVGLIVILFAALMIAWNLKGSVSRGQAMASSSVVLVVGVGVVALVLVLSLVPRVSNGQKLLDALRPANDAARVHGDRAGINMVSAIVDTEDPIMTPQGGAAAEVPKLIAFVSQKTGLSQAAVVAALQKNFPHTTALLQTIPLSSVTAELPGLLAFLEKTLQVSQTQLLAALTANFPRLAQAITNLPTVTSGWDQIQNIDGATRFDGTPIKTVPDVRTYFSSDVIPVLETQRGNYENLVSTSTINFIGPLVLIVGIIVIIYGLLMLLLARRLEPGTSGATRPSPATATGRAEGPRQRMLTLIASSTGWQVGLALGIAVVAVAAVIVIVIVLLAIRIAKQARRPSRRSRWCAGRQPSSAASRRSTTRG